MARYWCVPPEWTGETAFLLAGGPSLRDFDCKVLRGVGRVIAINRSYRLAPWADVLYFCDLYWWQHHKLEVEELFRGRYIVTLENQIDGVKTLRNTGTSGLETDPSGLRTGNNSGYQAINLAYHFGVKRIVLLGYDMRVSPDGRTHWHGGYTGYSADTYRDLFRNYMIPCFDTLVQPLRDAGIEVINATPNSALQCWSYRPIGEVLATLRASYGHTQSCPR
jgi:hypothetical protein